MSKKTGKKTKKKTAPKPIKDQILNLLDDLAYDEVIKAVQDVVKHVQNNVPKDQRAVPCVFVPKEDITAYEHAVLHHYLSNGKITYGDWKALEKKHEGITRHLLQMSKEDAA